MQIIKSAKDGVDAMIETGSAVQGALSLQPPTGVSEEARSRLIAVGTELSEIRDLLSRTQPAAVSPRALRPSTRYER